MDSLIPSNIRNLLLNHYLEVASDGPWEDLVCTLCRKLSMNAYQTFCGCTFCRRCIKRRLEGIDEMCPGGKADCQMEGLVFDRNVNRNSNLILRISRLKVVCPHESCRVVTEVSQMKAHMEVCPERPIDCPFAVLGCTSGGRVSSRRMKTHILEEAVAHSQMMMVRFGEIHKYTNEDPKQEIKRAEEQKNDRIYERREMNEDHIQLTGFDSGLQSRMEEAINALTDRMDADRKQSKKMRYKMETLKRESKDMKREIEEGRADAIKTQDEVEILKADVIIKTDESNNMKDEMEVLQRKIEEERAEVKKIKNDVDDLKKEAEVMVGRTNLNKEEGAGIIDGRVGKMTKTVDSLSKWINNGHAVGSLWFKVDGFEWLKKNKGTTFSPYLYSHINGYKLRIRVNVYSNLHVSDGCLCVSSVICKGEYDDVLSWPARGLSVSVSVINHHTKKAYRTGTIKYDNQYCRKPIDKDNQPYRDWWFPLPNLDSTPGMIVSDCLLLLLTARPP